MADETNVPVGPTPEVAPETPVETTPEVSPTPEVAPEATV